jgi:hypothetical protein
VCAVVAAESEKTAGLFPPTAMSYFLRSVRLMEAVAAENPSIENSYRVVRDKVYGLRDLQLKRSMRN